MFDVSFSELLLIGVIALIVIGPERLPKVARTLGHLVGRAQRYVSDVKTDIQREMDLDELSSLKGQMEDAAKSVKSSMQDASDSLRQPLDEAQKALKGASVSVDNLVKDIKEEAGPQKNAEKPAEYVSEPLMEPPAVADHSAEPALASPDTATLPLPGVPQAEPVPVKKPDTETPA
ncbi:twin-arginine translocase subunit TatB [Candidimonas sp. SYP-B2681]|uniref:Sec-independent protein translocase protein TatB n=1 Tax=Candidimonas sp. SYP-B2681 TaxID=2497686 RepID=UPI000F86C6C9|nr:Sec-independent protein translocase protein TatB [Candidimonas sp. SYP-B2681]RTZ43274.1 twin-arginine translocase subunit TatB [Candidimonas sp. SYP-B2681]